MKYLTVLKDGDVFICHIFDKETRKALIDTFMHLNDLGEDYYWKVTGTIPNQLEIDGWKERIKKEVA